MWEPDVKELLPIVKRLVLVLDGVVSVFGEDSCIRKSYEILILTSLWQY